MDAKKSLNLNANEGDRIFEAVSGGSGSANDGRQIKKVCSVKQFRKLIPLIGRQVLCAKATVPEKSRAVNLRRICSDSAISACHP
jgi:hypothetical protein